MEKRKLSIVAWEEKGRKRSKLDGAGASPYSVAVRRMLLLFLLFLCAASPSFPQSGRTLSVLYFEDLGGGGNAFIGKALTEMLIADLSALQGLTVVERESLEKVAAELEFSLSDWVDERGAPRVGGMLGAGILVLGSFSILGEAMIVSYRIVEVETAAIRGAGTIQGGVGDIGRLETELSLSVMERLKNLFPELELPPSAPASPKLKLEQLGAYGQALELGDRGQFARAREILEQILKENPDFPALKAELSRIEERIKAYDRRREELLKAESEATLDWNAFLRLTSSYMGAMRYSALLAFCDRAQANPPKEPEGSLTTALELIGYYRVLSLYMLKRWELLVPEGELFLKSYPASPYYPAVKNYTLSVLDELRELEARRKKTGAQVRPLLDEYARAGQSERDMTAYRIATEYFNGKLYAEALAYYRKINLRSVESRGLGGDTVLYLMFQCYYQLFRKEEAERALRSMEAFYPESSLLQAMRTLLLYFPQ